ncbi:MAG: SMC-Scp complex subunit ScpB, partial [Candidatus Aenigmarchaeota archaeon]|nr:SMC-Scp complex subunit ScpB [Candidatus Aenigmarchaeota archaeon]
DYRERVATLAPLADLSDGMMRTLSIVVLNQPIKQYDIVKFQGNKTYGYVKGLEDKGLIKTQKYGRTKLITVSSEFERYFGKDVEEIKKTLAGKVQK